MLSEIDNLMTRKSSKDHSSALAMYVGDEEIPKFGAAVLSFHPHFPELWAFLYTTSDRSWRS